MVNMGSGYLDLFRASLEPSSVGLLFLILSVIMAFGNAMAIKIIDIGSEYKFLYYLSLLMIITGATWIGVGFAAKLIFSDLFKFAGFSP